MLVLCLDARFSYDDLTLHQVEKNVNSLRMLRDEDEFDSEVTRDVSTNQRNRFVEIVDDLNFVDSTTALHGITHDFFTLTSH